MLVNSEESYPCITCGKIFRRKSCLTMHSKIHNKNSCSCIMCEEHGKHVEGGKKNKDNRTLNTEIKVGKAVSKGVLSAVRKNPSPRKKSVILDAKVQLKKMAEVKAASPSKKVGSGSIKGNLRSKRGENYQRKHVFLESEGTPKSPKRKSTRKAQNVTNSGKAITNRKETFKSEKSHSQTNKCHATKNNITANGRTKPFNKFKSCHNKSTKQMFDLSFKIFCTRLVHSSKPILEKPVSVSKSEKILVNNCKKKSFKPNKSLKQELKNRLNNRHFKCVICSRAYDCEDSLRNHIIIHVDEKLYKGLHCWKVRLQRL